MALPVYFISIDPKHDTLKKRKKFLKNFPAGSDWSFLITEETKTRELLAELKMGFSGNRGNGHAMHTMTLAILSSTGEILDTIPVLADKTEVAIAKIQALISK